jgi:hypothetical protein
MFDGDQGPSRVKMGQPRDCIYETALRSGSLAIGDCRMCLLECASQSEAQRSPGDFVAQSLKNLILSRNGTLEFPLLLFKRRHAPDCAGQADGQRDEEESNTQRQCQAPAFHVLKPALGSLTARSCSPEGIGWAYSATPNATGAMLAFLDEAFWHLLAA